MATWEDVRRLAGALPETTETAGGDGLASWRVRGKSFAWERPLRRGDLAALAARGVAAPAGAVLGVRTAHTDAKQALLAEAAAEGPGAVTAAVTGEVGVVFTTPHFDGYAAVLVVLDRIGVGALAELLTDSWLASAPKRLARTLAGPTAISPSSTPEGGG